MQIFLFCNKKAYNIARIVQHRKCLILFTEIIVV